MGILINNAGQTVIVPTLDADLDKIRDMFEVNILGFVRVTQAFASHVINAQGTIVNIASISSHCHTPWMGIYAGSKAAVTQFSDTLRMELKPFGVKVVTVQTGAVATETLSWAKKSKLPEGSRYKSVEDEIKKRANGEDGVPRSTPKEYAEQVVDDVLKGVNGQIWKGSFANAVKWTSWMIPGVMDSLAIN